MGMKSSSRSHIAFGPHLRREQAKPWVLGVNRDPYKQPRKGQHRTSTDPARLKHINEAAVPEVRPCPGNPNYKTPQMRLLRIALQTWMSPGPTSRLVPTAPRDARCCCAAASAPLKPHRSELLKYKCSPKWHQPPSTSGARATTRVQGSPLQEEDTAPDPEPTTQLQETLLVSPEASDNGHYPNFSPLQLPHWATIPCATST